MFKKNKDAEAKENGNNKGKTKTSVGNQDMPANGKVKVHSLSSWVVQPVFAIGFCMVLSYVLLEFLFLKPAEEMKHQQSSEAHLESISFTVNNYLKSQRQWMTAIASNLTSDDLSFEPLLKGVKSELLRLSVFTLEQLDQLDPQNASLSFASLDLLRRTARGEKNPIEAFLVDQQWFFQIAIPVYSDDTDANSKSLKTVVLGIFDFSGLQALIKETQTRINGQISIMSDGVSKPLIQSGSGTDQALETQIDHVQWRIRYAPAQHSNNGFDRVNIWIVYGLTLILMIILLTLLVRINMKGVQRDLQSAVKMITKAVESESKFLNNFQFGEVYVMANAIVGHVRQILAHQKARIGKLKNVKVTKAETVELSEDEPLFDDDLFDLDELDKTGSNGAQNFAEVAVQEKSSLSETISEAIFREYDIRGVVNQTLTPGIIELLGKSIASEALAQGRDTMCVGYDGRVSSAEYCDALVQGAVSAGMNVIIVGQVPTPVLYFATHHFETGTGVMITGSHNPAQYNGLKIMIAGNTLSGEAIKKLYKRIMVQDFAEGRGERREQTVNRAYIDTILNDIAVAAPLKVVIDAGNGVAGTIAPELIEELGCEVIPLHCEIDGNFPNHHPDPGNPDNLRDLISAVKEHQADIGIAFDGDGDRLGLVTNTGKIIWPDRLLMLFAKDVVSRNPGADIIYDVKCSRRLNSLISSYGGRPVMWKTGHSLMKAKMKETGALLAGEMSGHIFFKERWFGFDDGLYSAARLLEILGIEDKSSDEIFAGFPEDVSTPEINIPVTDESKFEIIEKLFARKDQFVGGNVSTIDGIRVDYPNGWGLCRASNTMPVLVLRFEADDEAALAEIKNRFVAQLKHIEPNLKCDF